MEQESKNNKNNTILILRPAFYTVQATILDAWAEDFEKKAKVCNGWVTMFEKTINKGAEFTEKYLEWQSIFSKQAHVCRKQAEMCRTYANDAKI